MGLATNDSHSHNDKVQTKLFKIPNFGLNRPNSKQHTAILKCQNVPRNVWPCGRYLNTAYRWPYVFLDNFDVYNSLYLGQNLLINIKHEDFVKLGVLFLTMWINRYLSHNLQTLT